MEVIKDPRVLQIAFLGTFLIAGLTVLDFDLPLWQPPLIVVSACATQFAMTRLMRVPPAGYLSPVITSLGLTLLLRSDLWWLPPLAAVVAIGSKFLLRFRGKHIFNPTNLGLAVAMLLSTHAWCSPSQWGENGVTVAWFAIFGLAVASRAFRSDVSLAFFATWVLLKLGRVLYLEQKSTVLFHQLSTGSLILFTFFMISDPKTTPDSRAGRIVLRRRGGRPWLLPPTWLVEVQRADLGPAPGLAARSSHRSPLQGRSLPLVVGRRSETDPRTGFGKALGWCSARQGLTKPPALLCRGTHGFSFTQRAASKSEGGLAASGRPRRR
jgi:hypothetical protein